MEDKIINGYNLFIRKNNQNKLIGSLSEKDETNNYIDIEQLDEANLNFIKDYPNLYDCLSSEKALFITYLMNEKEFFVTIKNKMMIGEYNDNLVWNDIITSTSESLSDALHKLAEKVDNKLEGRL